MTQNTSKIYVKANTDIDMDLSTFQPIKDLTDAANTIIVVAPFTDLISEVIYLLPDPYAEQPKKRPMFKIGTEEVEVSPSVFETWNVYKTDLTSAILNGITSQNVSSILRVQFSWTGLVAQPPADEFIGTFGSAASSQGGDLPETGVNIGDYFVCDIDNYNSIVAGIVFNSLDPAVWDGVIWELGSYSVTQSTRSDIVELAVGPGINAGDEEVDPSTTDLILSEITKLINAELELQRIKLDKDFRINPILSVINVTNDYLAVDDGSVDANGDRLIKRILIQDVINASQFDKGEFIDKNALPLTGLIDGQFATVINPLTPETLENEKWLVVSGVWTPTGTQKDATQGDIENLQLQIGTLANLNTPVIVDLVQSINSVYSQKGQPGGLAVLDTSSEIPYANIKDTYVNIIGTLLGTSPTVTELPTANTKRMTAYWYNSNTEFEDPSGLIFRRRGEIAYNINPISTNPTWLKTDSATIFTVNGILPDVDGDIEVMIEDIFGLREELDTKAFIVNNLDNPNDTDSLDTEQLVIELAKKSSAINNNSATGILELPTITINAGDDTALDIGAGRFRFVKFVNDILTTFNIDTPASTISLKNIGTQTNSTVYYFLDVNNNAVLGTDNGIVDPIQFRNKAYFGIAFHPQSVIMSAFPIGFYVNMPTNQLIDFVFSGNKSNSNVEGNNYSGVVATRELFVSSGKIRGFGFNLQNSLTDPNTSIQPSDSSFDFTIAYRDGAGGLTFEIVNAMPNTYDDGSGVLATIPGGAQASANYTIFRSGRFNNDIPGLIGSATFVLMPQTTYANITGAVAGFVAGETFNNIPGFIFSVVVQRYNLSARSGGVDFTSESDAIFKEIVLGGSGGSGGAGPSSVNASAVINDSANAEVLARGSDQNELNISIIEQQNWNSIPQPSAFVNVGGNVFEIRASIILTPQLNQSFILNFNPTGGLDGDLITVSIDAGVSSFPLVITSGQQLTYKQVTSKTRLIGGSINAPIRFTGTSYAWDDYLTMESNGNFLMSADMSMNGFQLTDLDPPFNDDDATTKKFVEDLVNVEVYDTLDDDTEILPQIVMTDKGVEVNSTIITATNEIVNGDLGNSYTSNGTSVYTIKPDGTFVVNSSYDATAQIPSITLGNKYYIKVKGDALAIRNQLFIRYSSGTLQNSGGNDTDVDSNSALMTAVETNLANIMFRGTTDVAGNPHQITEFFMVEITPTSPMFDLTVGEIDSLFPNYFDGEVSSSYTILSETKNIFNGKLESGSFDNGDPIPDTSIRSVDFTRVEEITYRFSSDLGYAFALQEYDINFNFIQTRTVTTFTPIAGAVYIKFRTSTTNQDDLNVKIQLEEGSVETSFIEYYADTNLVGGVEQREYNALRTFIDGRILIKIADGSIGGINNYSVPESIGAERAMHSRVINSANIDIKRLNGRISLVDVTGALVTDIATIYQDITVTRLQVDVSGTFHDVLHADSSFYLYGSVDIAEVIESAVTVDIRYLKVTL